MRGIAYILLVLAIAGTGLGTVGIAYSIVEDPVFLAPSVSLLIVPWLAWMLVRGRVAVEGKAAFESALGGFQADETGWYKGSGLALDRAGGKLLVASRGKVGLHPLSDLRSIQYVAGSTPAVAAGGASEGLGALLALLAIGSATAGHLGAGLFLVIGDRTWQVFGLGRAEADSWTASLRAAAPHALVKSPQ